MSIFLMSEMSENMIFRHMAFSKKNVHYLKLSLFVYVEVQNVIHDYTCSLWFPNANTPCTGSTASSVMVEFCDQFPWYIWLLLVWFMIYIFPTCECLTNRFDHRFNTWYHCISCCDWFRLLVSFSNRVFLRKEPYQNIHSIIVYISFIKPF